MAIQNTKPLFDPQSFVFEDNVDRIELRMSSYDSSVLRIVNALNLEESLRKEIHQIVETTIKSIWFTQIDTYDFQRSIQVITSSDSAIIIANLKAVMYQGYETIQTFHRLLEGKLKSLTFSYSGNWG